MDSRLANTLSLKHNDVQIMPGGVAVSPIPENAIEVDCVFPNTFLQQMVGWINKQKGHYLKMMFILYYCPCSISKCPDVCCRVLSYIRAGHITLIEVRIYCVL